MLKFQESLEEDYDLPKIIRVYMEDAKAPLIGKFPSLSFLPSILPFLSHLFGLLVPLYPLLN